MDNITILFIEDNSEIQESVRLIFEIHWPQARLIQAFRGREGIDLARSENPDIVILDLGLPDIDGLKVLREIRNFSSVPVIILTVRGAELDKIRGLELGADDYIVKPFGHKELLARINSVMGRRVVDTDRHESTTEPLRPKTSIDLESGVVTRPDRQVKLSPTELTLLKFLASLDGKPVSNREILARVWGEEYADGIEFLEAYIKRIREKIEEDPEKPAIIISENGGYLLSRNVL